MIAQGVTGHRWGVLPTSKADRARIDRILDEVGATAFADAPVAELSGGEQQRTRVGQAIAADPALLLCDEPSSRSTCGTSAASPSSSTGSVGSTMQPSCS